MDGKTLVLEYSMAAGDDSTVSDDALGARQHGDSIHYQYDALGAQQADNGSPVRTSGVPFVSTRLQPGSRRHKKAAAKAATLPAPAAAGSGTDMPGGTPDTSAGAAVGAAVLRPSSSGTQGLFISFDDILALQRYVPVAIPLDNSRDEVAAVSRDEVAAISCEAGDYRHEYRHEVMALQQTRDEFAAISSEAFDYRDEYRHEVMALQNSRDEFAAFSSEAGDYRHEYRQEVMALHQTRDEFAAISSEAVDYRDEYHHEVMALQELASSLKRHEVISSLNVRRLQLFEQRSSVADAHHAEHSAAAIRLHNLEREQSQAELRVAHTELAYLQRRLA